MVHVLLALVSCMTGVCMTVQSAVNGNNIVAVIYLYRFAVLSVLININNGTVTCGVDALTLRCFYIHRLMKSPIVIGERILQFGVAEILDNLARHRKHKKACRLCHRFNRLLLLLRFRLRC